MHTKIQAKEKVERIPAQIEFEYQYLRGDLICSLCNGLILEDSWENKDDCSGMISDMVDIHVCSGFKYDFDSPLTMKEQVKKAKERHEKKGIHIPKLFK